MSQGQFQAFVGLCRFEKFQDHEGTHIVPEPGQTLPTFEAPIACWVSSAVEYDKLLTQELPKKGYRLLRTEEVMPVQTWFEMKGFNAALGDLAAKVSETRGFQSGELRPVGFEQSHGMEGATTPEAEQNPLIITEHPYTPLPDQSAIIAFWKQEWISDDLKALLFGQDLPEEHQHILAGAMDPKPLIRTYFIVDATLRRKITKFFDLDMAFSRQGALAGRIEGENGNLGNIEYRSLFKGEAQEELKEVAPYLFDLTLPEQAYDDKDYVPKFHKDFFKSTWDPDTLERSEGLTHPDTGIFIRTTADFDTVWRHFRKFTRVRVEVDQRWVFFRFWDPNVAPSYFHSIKNLCPKVAQWFMINGKEPVISIIGIGQQTQARALWQAVPTWKTLGGVTLAGQLMLSDKEMESLQEYFEDRTITKILNHIRELCPYISNDLDENETRKIINESIEVSKKFDIYLDDDIAYFSYLSYIHTSAWVENEFYFDVNSILKNGNIAPYLKMSLIKKKYQKKFGKMTDIGKYKEAFSAHPRLRNLAYFPDFFQSLDVKNFGLRDENFKAK